MLGSQALETAIGLTVMFFILATAASIITETISRVFTKRSKDLEGTILEMVTIRAPEGREARGSARSKRLDAAGPFFALFKDTSIWQAAEAASGRTLWARRKVGNSYLSAKSFADAIHEVLSSPDRDPTELQRALDGVPSLKKRLTALVNESHGGLIGVKAGLESWFDETMDRAEGAYKRWASLVLFLVGLLLAVAGNASSTDVARDLWQNSATRAAVAEAASNVGEDPGDLRSVAEVTEQLTALHLPVGWDVSGSDTSRADNPIHLVKASSPKVAVVTVFGWVLTALLVMLGGPFWYDLLSRLVDLRMAGKKPPTAAEDETSSTKALTTAHHDDAVADRHELDVIRGLLGPVRQPVVDGGTTGAVDTAPWSGGVWGDVGHS